MIRAIKLILVSCLWAITFCAEKPKKDEFEVKELDLPASRLSVDQQVAFQNHLKALGRLENIAQALADPEQVTDDAVADNFLIQFRAQNCKAHVQRDLEDMEYTLSVEEETTCGFSFILKISVDPTKEHTWLISYKALLKDENDSNTNDIYTVDLQGSLDFVANPELPFPENQDYSLSGVLSSRSQGKINVDFKVISKFGRAIQYGEQKSLFQFTYLNFTAAVHRFSHFENSKLSQNFNVNSEAITEDMYKNLVSGLRSLVARVKW